MGGNDLKNYIGACLAEAPNAFRRGIVAVTALANIALLVALLVGWHLQAITALQISTVAIVIAALEIVLILPYRLWKANVAEIASLENRLTPKLKLSFDMNDPGCVRPNTKITAGPNQDIIATWYRIKVEASESINLAECRGRLTEVRGAGSNLLLGETPSLHFAQGDALSKTISPSVPEYLDFLMANDTHGAFITAHPAHLSQAVPWDRLFNLAGDYRLRIVVVSSSSTPASLNLLFKWTLDPRTSQILAVG
jgi:hypothetical protein